MAWSPDFKQNRADQLKQMKIIDRCNYDRLREYYAVLNGQVRENEKTLSHDRYPKEICSRKVMFNGSSATNTVQHAAPKFKNQIVVVNKESIMNLFFRNR